MCCLSIQRPCGSRRYVHTHGTTSVCCVYRSPCLRANNDDGNGNGIGNSVLALLPGFLVSGKIQGSVKTAKDFAKQQDELIKHLVAVDAWGKGDDKGSGCGASDSISGPCDPQS